MLLQPENADGIKNSAIVTVTTVWTPFPENAGMGNQSVATGAANAAYTYLDAYQLLGSYPDIFWELRKYFPAAF